MPRSFTFNPLPLASQVGLQPAAAVLDVFLPDQLGHMRESAARLNVLLDQSTRVPVPRAWDLAEQLRREGYTDDAELVMAVWERWREQRPGVDTAIAAEAERLRWQARRKASGNSPQARKQLRVWSQQARELVPPAVRVADDTARTINDVTQYVVPPVPLPISESRRTPSWR